MGLKINTQAPDFSLPSTSGRDFKLSTDLDGKACILFFYPKDFTQVCTNEVCEFRDKFSVFKDLDIEVIGINKDSIETHLKFKEEFDLPYELLTDKSGRVCKRYKAIVPIVGLPKRITYLLNKDHKIAGVFQDMFNAKNHIKEMVEQINKKSYL